MNHGIIAMNTIKSKTLENCDISIIIPTYNESQNIIPFLESIKKYLPRDFVTEAIVVDDNSPDGTWKVVDDYIKKKKYAKAFTINLIRRINEKGLSSAILNGIKQSRGQMIVVMDSDFSHPPYMIPKMVTELESSKYDIVVASRYIKGGKVVNWPFKRKVMSKAATSIAKKSLGINTNDPMSGFFAFKREIIEGLEFDAIGYKMLLEILVKSKGAKVKEIPYTFSDRRLGASKLGSSQIFDFIRSVWRLYRYGRSAFPQEKRISVRFLSKAARFYSVGASGVGINYLVSLLFTVGIAEFWYLHANLFGIFASMTSNFVLNKIWTFDDRDFTPKHTLFQYGKFVLFSSLGAIIQLSMVFFFIEQFQLFYPLALILAVLTAAFSNFILNKKWTFKEKLWS